MQMITFICYRIKSLIESLSTISYFLSYICLEYSTIVEDMWDCPNNITVNTEPGERFAHVYWTVPTVPDGYTQISDHEPGSEFPIGSTQVHYYLAQDSSTDHRLACEFKVTILGKCCFYVIQYICVVIWAYIVHIRLVKVCGLAWSCLVLLGDNQRDLENPALLQSERNRYMIKSNNRMAIENHFSFQLLKPYYIEDTLHLKHAY